MLIDKSYYDYDYSEPKTEPSVKVKPKSKEQLNAMLARFGFNTNLRSAQSKPMTADEIQRVAMEEMKEMKKDQ